MLTITNSQFNMWRACVAVVHLDKKVLAEEQIWVEEKINYLKLTDEQRLTLKSDMEKTVNLEEVLKNITDKKDLAFLVNTIKVIGCLDKDFSESERACFKKVEAIVLNGLDLKALEDEIETMEKATYREDEVYKVDNSYSAFEALYKSFLKFLNPGDYKFPENK